MSHALRNQKDSDSEAARIRRLLPIAAILAAALASAPRPAIAIEDEAKAGDKPPEVNLIGIPDGIRKHIEEAYAEADAQRDHAGKLGRLAMRYLIPAPAIAADCFKRASQLAPNDARWCYYEGLADMAAYRREDAQKAFERGATLDPKFAPLFVAWGDTLVTSNPSAAEEKYKSAVAADPKLARAHFGLGRACMAQDRGPDAIKHLQEAVKLAPQYSAAHAALADLFDKSERFKDAKMHRQLMESGTAAPPGNDPLLFDLYSECSSGTELLEFAEGLAGEGRLEEAIGLLEGAISRNSDDVALLHAAAVLLDKAGRYREAVTRFRRVLDLAPAQLETVLYLAQALTHTDDFISAGALVKEVVQQEPENLAALRLYSGLMLRLRRPEDAMPFLEKAAKLHPNDGSIRLALSMTCLCLDRIGPAIEHFKVARSGEPTPGDTARSLLSNLAQIFVDQRKSSAAVFSGFAPVVAGRLRMMGEAMEAGDLPADGKVLIDYPTFFARRAAYLARQGSFDDAALVLRTGAGDPEVKADAPAVSEYRKILAGGGDSSPLRHVLARVLVAAGDVSQANDAWQSIIKDDPKFEPAVIFLASSHLQAGEFAKAESVLRSGLKSIPESVAIANALAWGLATNPASDEKAKKEAVELAERVCKQEPTDVPSYWDTLATAHAANGNFDRAFECEGTAIRLAAESGKTAGTEGFKRRLKLFELKLPYRQEPAKPEEKN